jgi:hypothetical protein
MPTLKQAHLQFAQANRTKPKLQKSLLCQRTKTQQMDRQITTEKEERRHNSGFAKKRVQCLNEALCFVSSSVLADSLVLRNPLLRQARNR